MSFWLLGYDRKTKTLLPAHQVLLVRSKSFSVRRSLGTDLEAMAALLRSGGSRLGIGPHGSASVGLVARSASLLQRRCYQGNLQDKDRIFTNL